MTIQDLIGVLPSTIMLIIFIVFLKTNKIYKKVKLGPFEAEAKDEQENAVYINPDEPCPYEKAYTATRNEIRNVQNLVHDEIKTISADVKELSAKTDQLIHKVDRMDEKMDDMDTDQLKMIFRSSGQPQEDRLYAGLRYVNKGENSDTREEVVGMSLKWLNLYEGICVAKPEYKIPEVEKQKRGAKQ